MKVMSSNTRVHFDYEILDTFEAGISLLGTEVKSLRTSNPKLDGSHVIIRGGEAFLVGMTIPAFQKANAPADYEADRVRKLLLSRKEIAVLAQKGEQAGLTIVPIKLYSIRQKIKVQIALARGKKKHDKRESIKARDTKRDIERELKNS